MNPHPPSQDASWPPSLALQAEEVCGRFEPAWVAAGSVGEGPRIEDYLGDTPEPKRSQFLREMLALELVYRRDRGEQPTRQEYQQRFPAHADLVNAVFAEEEKPPSSQVRQPVSQVTNQQSAGTVDRAMSSPTADASSPRPHVPGYEILGELGHGGMGVVYKARQIKANRIVALKMTLARAHATLEQKVRFQIEAEAVAALQHPNIVQLYEVGECDGLPFFSLEFVEGGSLDQKLKGMPRSPKQAAQLVETLARAMQTAHQAGVVHRDLKPANVLVGKDWELKITDFGLAKQLDTPGQTASGVIMGTPSYMAPEQAGGRSKHIGPAADVYALGAILYELLTGRPPFRAATQMDTLLQVLSEDPVPPSRLNPKLARDLETICLTCLRKDPARRYASAEELANDLRRFLTGEPIAARPVGRFERAVKWTRRNPAVAGLLASLVLGTAVATLFAIWAIEKAGEAEKEAKRADRETGLAKQNATQAEKDKRAAQFQALRAENARHALQIDQALRAWQQNDLVEAKRILGEVDPAFQQTWETRHLHQLCRRKAMPLLGHTGGVTSVALSGDGRRIASGSLDQTVKVWDTATGQALLTLKGHKGQVTSVALSRDGRRIASGS